MEQTKMMIPTGLQFMRAFTMPRAMVRMFKMNYPAWKERVISGRRPWSSNIDYRKPGVGLEYQGERHKPSNERYLRPTWGVDPTAPEILALAKQLGAGEKTKRAFAEAAFNYVKNQINHSPEAILDLLLLVTALGYLSTAPPAIDLDRFSTQKSVVILESATEGARTSSQLICKPRTQRVSLDK